MDLNSMFSQVIPTMILAWIIVMITILVILQSIRRFRASDIRSAWGIEEVN